MSNQVKHKSTLVVLKNTRSLTGEQPWEFSEFEGFSWLLLAAVDLSSVLESEADAEFEDAGFLRLLFIADDKQYSDVTG